MSILKKIGRVLLILIAILVIIISLGGIVGAWWANSVVTNVTLQVFSIVETGVSIVETGVERVDTFVADSRTEVQQAAETITTVSSDLQTNSPVLTALNTRLQERLAPRVDRIQETLAPVHDALVSVSSAVRVANSIPFMSTKFPAIEKLDTVFTALGQLKADIKQLNDTLQAAVVAQKNELTQETTDALTGITTRIDTRLATVESTMQEVMADINALQERNAQLKSRLLLIYDLTALAVTLLMFWLVYSQVVVIRQQWSRLRSPVVASPALPSPGDAAMVASLPDDTPAVVPSEAAAAAAEIAPETLDPPAPAPAP